MSIAHLPRGSLGFLIGHESAPADGGFQVGTSDPDSQMLPQQWTIETVRQLQPNQEIKLVFQPDPDNSSRANDLTTAAPPLIQCLHISAQEF